MFRQLIQLNDFLFYILIFSCFSLF